MGLEEQKENNKTIIGRLPAGKRHAASFLELALAQISPLKGVGLNEETKFEIALDLVITWVNRVLFLKLLEAHQLQINNGEAKYRFLNYQKIQSFDWLKALFFNVLAKKIEERVEPWISRFPQVPYLNSSLYEPTENEELYLPISAINDKENLELHNHTVLKEGNKLTKRTGKLETLDYFFQFLDAYDFGAEPGEADVRSEVKTLINASVLGLIFEKINGYKEGSIYTPGYITMYMCRETIRRAIVQKFSEKYGWKIDAFDDIPNHLGRSKNDILEYNKLINSLTIADPAVGSGHFLVSALNELLACKSELGILADSEGKAFYNWRVEIENDELLLYNNESNELFRYKRNPSNRHINPEHQRLMETLFQEKRSLIEGSLFGVDINSNSVKICRLRLWIELLKNSYYKQDNKNELETLPNIDINIKVGNSLVSKFGLQEDLSEVFNKQKFRYQTYKDAVNSYKRAPSAETRADLMDFIRSIKEEFKQTISLHDPKRKKLYDLKGKVQALESWVPGLFGVIENEEETRNTNLAKFKAEAEKLDQELNDAISQKLYANAFEWRFEFPEVLDVKGNFVGFDVVIGNPPYIRQEELTPDFKNLLSKQYTVGNNTSDILVYFFELAGRIGKPETGLNNFIVSNKWMLARYGKNLRNYLSEKQLVELIDFADLPVFEKATTYPIIVSTQQKNKVLNNQFPFVKIKTLEFETNLQNYIAANSQIAVQEQLNNTNGWNLANSSTQILLLKLKKSGIPLGEFVEGKIYRGILTGLNKAFLISKAQRDAFIEQDPKNGEIIKPFLSGRDIKRYQKPTSETYVIYFPSGYTNSHRGNIEPETWIKSNFKIIFDHLVTFQNEAKKRTDFGNYWWELRACAYFNEFSKPKIIYQEIATFSAFAYDKSGSYTNKTAYIWPTTDIWFLGLMNSKTIWFYLNLVCPKLQGNALSMQSIFLFLVPIPIINEANQSKLTALVTQILAAKEANPKADTSTLEQEIDQIVFELYGLTPEEIAIVESNT